MRYKKLKLRQKRVYRMDFLFAGYDDLHISFNMHGAFSSEQEAVNHFKETLNSLIEEDPTRAPQTFEDLAKLVIEARIKKYNPYFHNFPYIDGLQFYYCY